MNLALSSLANRLKRTLRSCPRLPQTPLPAIRSSSRSYSMEKRLPRSSLFYRMFPLGDPSICLVPDLERSFQKRKHVPPAELQHIVRQLRKRNRYKQALEVSEWLSKKGILSFMPGDHAVHLDLIGRVRGSVFAETYFNSMGEEGKNEKTYGALLNCYVRERLTEKSLSHLEDMKKLGFAATTLTYNDIMCLYTNSGQHEKVPTVLTEMKEIGVMPDNFSYRICISSYGVRSNISEVERLLEEMEHEPQIIMDWTTYAVVALIYIKAGLTDKAVAALNKSEEKIEKRSGVCYNHLICLHGRLRNKAEMKRLWKLQKLNCKKFINRDYTTILGALVRMGELEEAETLLKEWESSGMTFDFHVPNILLVGYHQKGLVEKAEEIVESFVKKGRTPISGTWGILATGFAAKGEARKACQYLEKALRSYAQNVGWQPNPKAVLTILHWLGDEADVKSVETLVELLKLAMPMDRNMFHALMKAYIRAGKEVSELLQKLKDKGLEEDEETKEILNLQKIE